MSDEMKDALTLTVIFIFAFMVMSVLCYMGDRNTLKEIPIYGYVIILVLSIPLAIFVECWIFSRGIWEDKLIYIILILGITLGVTMGVTLNRMEIFL